MQKHCDSKTTIIERESSSYMFSHNFNSIYLSFFLTLQYCAVHFCCSISILKSLEMSSMAIQKKKKEKLYEENHHSLDSNLFIIVRNKNFRNSYQICKVTQEWQFWWNLMNSSNNGKGKATCVSKLYRGRKGFVLRKWKLHGKRQTYLEFFFV